TISLKTDAQSQSCFAVDCRAVSGLGGNVPPIADLTGNIVLGEGSVIDVSSGGRINQLGFMQADGKGRAAGNGGNVSLLTYGGTFNLSQPYPPTWAPLSASVVLPASDGTPESTALAFDQTIHAFGFAQGGTLSIQIAGIHIGNVSASSPGTLNL